MTTKTTTRKRAARPRKATTSAAAATPAAATDVAPSAAAAAIPLTVALPTYNNGKILWLQLESLLRQDTMHPFEVLVLECPKGGEYPSERVVSQYIGRFAERGVDLKYIKSSRRMPLMSKWIAMAKAAASDNLMMVASDNYTPATAVERYVAAFDSGANWIDCDSGVFYDIATKAMATWTMPEGVTGLLFATHSKAVAGMNDTALKRGIDYEIYLSVPHDRRVNITFNDGLLTDGANTISLHRAALYNTGRFHRCFSAFDGGLQDRIPADVAERLEGMKPFVVV